MFRTSCSEHVRNMFRTSRIAISTQRTPYGMPLRPQIWEIRHFLKLFTLLVFEKLNSQNRHVCHFHASKNPDTDNRWEAGRHVPNMFRTFGSEQCSVTAEKRCVCCKLLANCDARETKTELEWVSTSSEPKSEISGSLHAFSRSLTWRLSKTFQPPWVPFSLKSLILIQKWTPWALCSIRYNI